jgi:hypothetical protein
MEKVAELQTKQPEGNHPMIMSTINNTLYIIDGNSLYKMEIPVITIWQRIWRFIKF